MSNAQWFLLIGSLLVVMGVFHAAIRRLPITASIIYLAVGVVVGPTVLHLFHFNPLKESQLLEVLTEVAVLISLYSAGVKMPAPWTFNRWRKPVVLATLSLAVSVGLVAAFAVYALHMPMGLAILLGAIVAPTDPVLATEVQIRHPRDRDRLRFSLTCEAGMNDGSAFPFVMLGLGLLGLHDLGENGLRWFALDVVWATGAGILIGILAGAGMARIIRSVQREGRGHTLMHDFIGLGLVGVVYGVSELVSAWGFLAVFFAAVSLRQTELKLARQLPNADESGGSAVESAAQGSHQPGLVSEGSLIFKEHLERLSSVVLVILVGGSLFLNSWSLSAVSFALFLFFVARPASILVGRLFFRSPRRITAMVAWFGIRGIGSLYYLMYSIQHGLPEEQALELIHLTLIVIVMSILIHGISVTPMMRRVRTSMVHPPDAALAAHE